LNGKLSGDFLWFYADGDLCQDQFSIFSKHLPEEKNINTVENLKSPTITKWSPLDSEVGL
jgi:hypothetical protein